MNEVLTSIKSISEEIRVRILLLLLDREACVCELMAVFGMAQSKLSHHLIILRDAGLLQDEKRGKWNYYRVNTKSLSPINKELVLSLPKWSIDDEVIQKDKRKLEEGIKRMQICCP
jgi:ArsR family transcriptional regulator, arsenate/arsenite/antimonite-responsive transcriptional repressor